MDALRVPLKTIQERIGHALTGSFTLDVYGGVPEFKRNVEAGRLAGAEIATAMEALAEETKYSLTAHETKGSGDAIS